MKAHSLHPLIWIFFSLRIALGQDSPIGQISGRVEDPTSSPIAGASVTLLSLNRIRQTTSTSDGAFQFEGLEEGAYAIEATAPGFAKKIIPVTLRPSQSRETITVVLNVGNMPDMEKCGRDVSVRYEGVNATGPNLIGTLRDYFSHKPISNAEISIASEGHGQGQLSSGRIGMADLQFQMLLRIITIFKFRVKATERKN